MSDVPDAPPPLPRAQRPGPVGPVFYQRPRALDPKRHRKAGLHRTVEFAFARDSGSVALTTVEFALAAGFYPIVFTDAEVAMALAVLGLRPNQNLFVDAEGKWRPNSYVPAYVRRYPYIFVEADGTLTLCIDEAAPNFDPAGGEPLFVGDRPSPETERALQFCSQFQANAAATREFVTALWERNLLIENQADVKLDSGRQLVLGGFHVIDENRFNVLPDDVVLDWRRRGWLGLVYAHFLSTARWNALVALTAQEEMANA